VAKTWRLLPQRPGRDSKFGSGLAASASSPLNSSGIAARAILNLPPAFSTRPCAFSIRRHYFRAWTWRPNDSFRRFADKKKICIYGDYDVDGATGTSILWRTLVSLGADTTFMCPIRLDEGYGPSTAVPSRKIAQTSQVIVTVDCGIANVAEVGLARQLGLEIIVTDHHEMGPCLPEATAIVHPRLPGGAYPFAGLSGAGVALKLAWAVCQRAAGSTRVAPAFREFLLERRRVGRRWD